MQIESFWQGWHKKSKKPYFNCGSSSRTGSKSTEKNLKEMLDVIRTFYNNSNYKLTWSVSCVR